LPTPALSSFAEASAEPIPAAVYGARVRRGVARRDVPEPLIDEDWGAGGRIVSSREQAAVLVPQAGRFWVERGAEVTVEAAPTERPTAALFGTVGAFVLAQQGRFALHASVVEIDGRTVAIAGRRGAGKSTTALALLRAGHRLVTDDVVPLDFDGSAAVHRPAGRPINIDPATAGRLGVSLAGGLPVAGDSGKLALPNPAADPVTLEAVVVLRTTPHPAPVSIRPLSARDGAVLVHRWTFRRPLLDPVWGRESFAWAAEVARRVPVSVLARPAGEWTVDAVVEALTATPP
jgi:hypothetical protein